MRATSSMEDVRVFDNFSIYPQQYWGGGRMRGRMGWNPRLDPFSKLRSRSRGREREREKLDPLRGTRKKPECRAIIDEKSHSRMSMVHTRIPREKTKCGFSCNMYYKMYICVRVYNRVLKSVQENRNFIILCG